MDNTPVLVIENEADDAVPANHSALIYQALATADKEIVSIHGANHYYVKQPEELKKSIDKVIYWSQRRGFIQ